MADAVVKEVMAAEAARKASGNMASSSNMEKQISEQMVGQSANQKLFLYVLHLFSVCFILPLLTQVKVLETAKKSVAQRQKMNELQGIVMLTIPSHMSPISCSHNFCFASVAA